MEYDADTHAVIKVNLKHRVEGGLGVRASVFDSQGRKNSDSEQVQLTYDSHSTNAFLSVANSSNRYKTDQDNSEKTTVAEDFWNMSSSMPKWKSYYYNQTIHGGISTDLAKNQTIGGSLSYSKEIDRWGGNSINEMYRNNQLFESLNSNILSHASYDQWIGNVFYDGTFSEKWKLMFNADYVSRKANDNRINQETGSMTSQHETTNDNATSHHIYAGNMKVSYHVDKNLSFSVGADASYVDEKKNYLSLDDEREQSTSRLHAEETKVAAFAGCDHSFTSSQSMSPFPTASSSTANPMTFRLSALKGSR